MNWINAEKELPKKDGWYMIICHDDKKGETRKFNCFWRNKPKKVYYNKNGKISHRFKGNAGWSKQNLRNRKVIAWSEIEDLNNVIKELI